MRCEAIDEWRRHCARKRAHLYDCASLDVVRDETTGETYADLIESPRCVDPGARHDVQYLVWYFGHHGLWLCLAVTLLNLAGYSQREAARFLGVSRENYRDNLLPRWQGICQQILSS